MLFKNHFMIYSTIVLSLARVSRNMETSVILDVFKNLTKEYFKDKMVLLLYPKEESSKTPKQLSFVKEDKWDQVLMEFLISSNQQSVILSDENFPEPNFNYFRFRMKYQKSPSIIILLQNADLDMLIKLTDHKLWSSRARILIVVESDDKAGELLRVMWNVKRALYVTIMNVSDKSIQFYGADPYKGVNNTLMERFEDSEFKIKRILYPNDKIPNNFNRYIITAGVTYSEPYVLQPEKPGIYHDGVEIRIITTIGKHLNYQIAFKESPPGENPFIAVVNGKFSGLFGLLNRREVDMIFFGFQGRFDRFLISDTLYPHTQDNLVWITPVPDPLPVWQNLYKVFTIEIWIGVLVTLIVTSVTLYLSLPEPITFSDCILDIFALNLNYGVGFKFTDLRIKLFFLFVFVYALHMTSAYQSYLFMLWSTPQEAKPFETTDEAADAGIIAYLYPSGKPAYNQSNHNMWNKILSKGHHVYSDRYWETLPIISDNRTAMTLMMENVAKYEVSKRMLYDNKRLLLNFIKQKHAPYRISIFLCPTHPLTELFNKKQLQLIEGGFVNYWIDDFLTIYLKSLSMDEDIAESKPLTIQHFLGAFMVLGLCWGLGIGIFIVEVFFKKRLNIMLL